MPVQELKEYLSKIENCFAILWLFCLDFKAYNHGLKGPQSFTPILIVRSGPGWRQDLVILSPEGPCDSTCQLRFRLGGERQLNSLN